jgi:hypothetical protein
MCTDWDPKVHGSGFWVKYVNVGSTGEVGSGHLRVQVRASRLLWITCVNASLVGWVYVLLARSSVSTSWPRVMVVPADTRPGPVSNCCGAGPGLSGGVMNLFGCNLFVV